MTWEPGLTRDFWWQPYDRTLGDAVRASARLVYGRNGERLRALREGAVPLLKVDGPHAAQGPLSRLSDRPPAPATSRCGASCRARAHLEPVRAPRL